MRPAGGFTTEMIDYSQSVDVYQIYADMVAYDACRHTYIGPQAFLRLCGTPVRIYSMRIRWINCAVPAGPTCAA